MLTILSNSHPDEFNLLLTIDSKFLPKQAFFTCIKPKCNLSGLSFFALYRTKHSSAYTVEKKHVSNKINKNFGVKTMQSEDEIAAVSACIGASFGGYFWTENPWDRHLLENGIIIGSIFIAWRIWITKDIFKISINEINRGNYLPIFLLGACGPALLTGLLGQPTTLGFAIFGSGLCLASTKRSFS